MPRSVAPVTLAVLTSLVACQEAPAPRAPAPAVVPAPRNAASAQDAQPPPRDDLATVAAAGLASIRPEAISATIRFLADDLLEGRATGERGFDVAARYVATELQAAGITPAGDGGTYFQRVPLVAMTSARNKSRVTLVKGKTRLALKDGADLVVFGSADREAVDASAPVVFAGYGITAPEFKHDDVAGLDLVGKIALVLRGAPLSDKDDYFPPVLSAYYGDFDNKVVALRARGAVGVLSALRPEDEARYSWAFVAKQKSFENMDWLDGDHGGTAPPEVGVRGVMPGATLAKILAAAKSPESVGSLVEKAHAGTLRGFDTGLVATVHHENALRRLSSENVVGVLKGSDPALAGEYVVYSAHLDHLGRGEPVDGDAIYNGADDNASGSATVLAIARAFAALPEPPRRSILFLFTTGEEKGLLGAEYFAHHPTVPAPSIVANLNVDGNCPTHDVRDIVPVGVEHSTLARATSAAARAFGLVVSPDPDPGFALFIRSDQYAFVKRGVPSAFLLEGDLDEHGKVDANLAADQARQARRYHTPRDEWDPSLDYAQVVKMARVDFLVGLEVANDDERPRWNPGDFFARFAR